MMKADLSVLTLGSGYGKTNQPSPVGVIPFPSRRWKTRLLLPGTILAATAGIFLYTAGRMLWPATTVRVVPVMVKAGTASGDAGGKLVTQAPGWVEADPFATAISALADGVVAEVLVLEGEKVEAGQVVARLVPDDAKLALARAEGNRSASEAELHKAQAALKAAQDHWNNPIELERKLASAEATLAERRAELERWPAELAVREAKAVEAEADYQRIAALHEQEQSSPIEFIRVKQEYVMRRAMADSKRAEKPMLEAKINALTAEVQAAREQLRLRIGDVQALEEARAAVARAEAEVLTATAARDEARLRLERMAIRSPMAGVVMARLVEPGAKLMLSGDNMQSAYVLRLYDPKKLQVRVDVPLADAAKVGVGQPAEVVVDVLPDRIFPGHVTRIVNEADVQKNTLQVKVAIHAPSPELKPEMLARAKFFTVGNKTNETAGATDQRLYVPQELLHKTPDGRTQVWLADQVRNRAVLRVVKPGSGKMEGWVEVEEGLLPGDRLIEAPAAALRDGQTLRLAGESSANPINEGGHHHGAH